MYWAYTASATGQCLTPVTALGVAVGAGSKCHRIGSKRKLTKAVEQVRPGQTTTVLINSHQDFFNGRLDPSLYQNN
jgi:hypothetical protein